VARAPRTERSRRGRASGPGRRAGLRTVPPALALALVLAVVGAPLGRAVGSDPAPRDGPEPFAAGSGPTAFAVTVSWGGVEIGAASSPSDAFAVGGGESVPVAFNYSGPAASQVALATLSMKFLGVALSSESIAPSTVGAAEMNWTFGPLIDLTEGIYEIDAELVDSAGQVLFEQPFYVDAKAPYTLGSAIAFFALVLATVEAYSVAANVRLRLRQKRGRR
jgi:hypothetical protein